MAKNIINTNAFKGFATTQRNRREEMDKLIKGLNENKCT